MGPVCQLQLLSTHRDLDDLVKHDIRREVEVEDEILEGRKTRVLALAAPPSEQCLLVSLIFP